MTFTSPRALFGALALCLAVFAGCDASELSETSPGTPADAFAAAGATTPAEDDVIPGQYIVVLSEQPAAQARGAVGALAELTAGLPAEAIGHVYEHAVTGFAATLSEAEVADLRADPRVAYVQPDRIMRTVGAGTQAGATWGLDRIDQRAGRDGSYSWNVSGEGVTAYVIDTGVRISHADFGGRASYGYDAVDNDLTADDCNGHGTHVAGTVGGTTYGVAKDVDLVAVRVLGCGGTGPTSQIVAGIDWVTANAQLPAVANMSLGGGRDAALDAAVANSIAAGIQYSIAAGNGFFGLFPQNACGTSPARVPEAITVSATDRNDRRASWANYGDCVDFFAPGIDVTSAWYTNNGATNTISGTSMAAPHVAGAAALFLELSPNATPREVRDALFAATTQNAVQNSRSANAHLLYSLFDGPPPSGITLSGAGGVLADGRWRAALDWAGAGGATVEVYANGEVRAETANDGRHVFTFDAPAAAADVVAKVCESGSARCSNEITLSF